MKNRNYVVTHRTPHVIHQTRRHHQIRKNHHRIRSGMLHTRDQQYLQFHKRRIFDTVQVAEKICPCHRQLLQIHHRGWVRIPDKFNRIDFKHNFPSFRFSWTTATAATFTCHRWFNQKLTKNRIRIRHIQVVTVAYRSESHHDNRSAPQQMPRSMVIITIRRLRLDWQMESERTMIMIHHQVVQNVCSVFVTFPQHHRQHLHCTIQVSWN